MMMMMIVPPRSGRLVSRVIGAKIALHDDAGVERTIATFQSEDVPDLGHPVTAGALARLRSAAATRGSKAIRFALAIVVVVSMMLGPATALAAIRLPRAVGGRPWPVLLVLLCAVVAFVLGMIVVLPRIMARAAAGSADLLADALLRMRRCAACGYPLAADAHPQDGRHICSECGASWNDARIGPVQTPSGPPGMRAVFLGVLSMSVACRSRTRDDAGRLYGVPPSMSHMRMPRLPGDREVSRATRGTIALMVSGIVVGVLAIVGWLVLLRGELPVWGVILAIVASVVLVPIVIFGLLRHLARRTRFILLRRRICVACRQRLRRDGTMLHCAACDATWARPVGARGAAR